MERTNFEELLFKTSFCCMASDGEIHGKELLLIKKLCQSIGFFHSKDIEAEINSLVARLNKDSHLFFEEYFDLIESEHLSKDEELEIIQIALETINADEIINYSEIKFFKVIRGNLEISDEKILEAFPGNDQFLEKDIDMHSGFEKTLTQYFKDLNLPQLDFISIQHLEKDL